MCHEKQDCFMSVHVKQLHRKAVHPAWRFLNKCLGCTVGSSNGAWKHPIWVQVWSHGWKAPSFQKCPQKHMLRITETFISVFPAFTLVTTGHVYCILFIRINQVFLTIWQSHLLTVLYPLKAITSLSLKICVTAFLDQCHHSVTAKSDTTQFY